MTEGTELIVAEKLDPAVLFTDGGMKKIMDGIRGKLDEFEADLSTTAGRKEIASMSRKVSSSKVFLENIKKQEEADAKAKIKSLNSVWKPAEKTLDQWRDETRQPLTDWEAEQTRKEEELKEGIRKKIQYMHDLYWILNGTGTAEQLQSVISELEAIEIVPEVYFGLTTEAEEKRDEILATSRQALETRERLDREETERKKEDERLKAEREKLEEERKAQAEIEAERKREADAEAEKLRKVQEALEMAQAKIDAEKAALKAEQDRKDKEQFKKEAKEQAEKDALAKFEREEFDRIEKELADAAEKRLMLERQERLKPDKEKLLAFSQFLGEGVKCPQVQSKEAQFVVHDASTRLCNLAEDIYQTAQKM